MSRVEGSSDGESEDSSSASSPVFHGIGNIVVDDDMSLTSSDPSDMQDIIGRLDEASLSADIESFAGELNNSGPESNPHDSDSLGTSSVSSTGNRDDATDKKSRSQVSSGDSKEVDSGEKQPNGVKQKSSFFSRRRSSTKETNVSQPEASPLSEVSSKRRLSGFLQKIVKTNLKKRPTDKSFNLSSIRIDRLPQVFVAKYIGKKDITCGEIGVKAVRQPVDDMVGKIKKALSVTSEVQIPLVYVIVSPKGLDIREHKLNKVKSGVDYGLVPLDFIAYGVQDVKFWKVFAYISVKQLSSRTKVMECHAFICDSPVSTRKMTLSLGASFKLYEKKLRAEGKPHNFQIELRTPDELSEEYGLDTDT